MSRPLIDFTKAGEARSRLGSWILAVAFIAIAASSAVWWQVSQDLALAQQSVRAATQKAEGLTKDNEQRQRLNVAKQAVLNDVRWQRAAQEINTPWLSTLNVIEQVAQAPAYLLAARFDPGRDQVELEGVAPDFATTLRVLAALQEACGVCEPRLVSRDTPALNPGAAASELRFVMQTHWRPQ